jgi:pimeloyl-ACP methyl ester carboxylesterase
MRKFRFRATYAAVACAGLVLGATAAAHPSAGPGAPAGHYAGSLADGATWIADVPDGWNGTLVLFSHGYTPGPTNPPRDAPTPAAAAALLAEGYALAGSSYAQPAWALGTAADDQLGTLAAFRHQIGRPRTTIALGQSMGGLVSAELAERGAGRIDGVVNTCGLLAGGVDLNNYQLDGQYALQELLLGNHDIPLVRYSSPADGQATANALTALAGQAQPTASGRARFALAAALMNVPTWAVGQPQPARDDYAAQEQAQYAWIAGGLLSFIDPARYTIEQPAGGNGSWNIGVDYGDLFARLPDRDEVVALYRAAHLDLRADLRHLTAAADITPDLPAVRWLDRTSNTTGRLTVPTLSMHTVADQLAPVEFEHEYARRVAAAGRESLLRQAFVQAVGHCNFTAAEYVTAVRAVRQRLHRSGWGAIADPERLQADAQSLGLDGAAFIHFRPGPLVNHRRLAAAQPAARPWAAPAASPAR